MLMKIELDDELQRFVQQEVASGRYADETAVIRDALMRMRRTAGHPSASLKAAVQHAEQQLDRGERADFDADSIIAEERQRYHQNP
jgi:putative addiction module CopG family antidote